MCPLLLPPECWCEPITCYVLTDSIFQCKCGLEKSSEPSPGKTAPPKAPCWGTRMHRLSWALSGRKTGTNSVQGGTKDILPGVQRPLPCFSYPCVMISYSDCKGFFLPPSLCSGPCGFYRNVHIKQSLAVLYNHPGMQWVSHGALLNTAVHWPSWTINIWSMANVLWGRRFVISVNTKGLLKWPSDFSFTSGVPKVMKLENKEVENQDVIFLLFKQWEFI